MKKNLTLAAFVMFATALTAAPTGPATAPKSTQPELKNATDSLYYAIGLFYGEGMKRINDEYGLDIDTEKIFEVAKQAMAGKSTDSYEQFSEFIYDYVEYRLPAERLKEAEAFLEKLQAENPDVKKSESGLVYQIIAPGDDKRATGSRDELIVKYTKTFADGTPAHRYNSSDSQNPDDSITLYINNQIAGCAEGLRLVGVGGKIKLWLHPDLAYGAYYGSIPRNSLLVYEMEVLDIINHEESDDDSYYYNDYYGGGYVYDDDGNVVEYPASDDGYVWKMVKKAKPKTSYTDDDGNVWKKVKTPAPKSGKKK